MVKISLNTVTFMMNSFLPSPSLKEQSASGFTLVELAIVLMIIGLLIGGVLRGQELMNNARVTALIQQVKAYQGAIVTFNDTYSSYPGDIPTAVERVPGCTAANFCFSGDGNGIIGSPALSAVQLNQSGSAVPARETSMFWKHLAMTHLISGIKPSADPSQPASGDTHPQSKLANGVFVIATKTTGEPDSFASGPLLKLQQAPASTGYALSPMKAFQVDTKMDDGMPNAGFVAAENVGSGCKTNDGQSGVYAADKTDTPRCVMYFKI